MGNMTIASPRAANTDSNLRAALRGALIGGTVAGVLDIFVAAVINGLGVGVILHAIASGLLGRASFAGGAATIVVGFVLQVAMSLIIAAIYGGAAMRLPVLVRRPASMGALFGVGVFIVMNFVVVPLSAAVHPKHPPSLAVVGLNLLAMILFGLIVALSQARFGLKAQR